MKLICYVIDGYTVDIVPASPVRDWMHEFHEKFAYGCLPMQMANTLGWEIRSPIGFTVIWNGGPNSSGITILEDEDSRDQVRSRFGGGILSFRVPAVFRTEPGFGLYVQAPPNQPKANLSPMSAIVETDWSKTIVSMNWQILQPKVAIRFRKGEPLCQIFPIRVGDVEAVAPEMRNLSEEPELEQSMKLWHSVRAKFNADLRIEGSDAQQQKWPGQYRRGEHLDGSVAPPGLHRNRLYVKPFDDKTGDR